MDGLTLRDLETVRQLYLFDEGKTAELDIDGLDRAFELDRQGVQRIRDWADGWLAGHSGAQTSLIAPPPEPVEREEPLGFRDGDPDTSRRAALLNFPRRESQRGRLLEMVAAAGERGLTYDEARHQGLYSADRRMTELRRGGWIEERVVALRRRYGDDQVPDSWATRTTDHGAEATVYVATERAQVETGRASHRPAA